MQLKPLILALTLALPPAAEATNLSDVFRDAQAHDAQYAAARAAYQAGQEKAVQGRSGLLPNINLGGNALYNNVSGDLREADFNSTMFEINATQPLYRKQNWVQYAQSKEQVKIVGMQFKSAEQDLILRVAQAYFDVLQSQDNIAFINAQKAAITEQLASAKRNFEVGTATITDTHEAQARYDLAVAQEIAEQNSLNIRLRALEKLIGKPAGSLDTLVDGKLLQTAAGNIDDWADRASTGNLQAEIQRIAKTIADQEVERNRAGHYPTLDAVAGYTVFNNQNFGTIQVDTRTGIVGVEFNMPIYQGGLTNSRVREAVANQEKARQDVEAAAREASLRAREAWLNVNSGVARVRALEQALTSTKAQLDSTKLGLQVGVRTSLDVLNAEQQVLSARRDLAAARYAYLQSGLALKAAVGSLSPADLAEIDKYLRPPAAATTSSSLPDTGVASLHGKSGHPASTQTTAMRGDGQRMQLKMATRAPTPTTSQQR
jgi:outer membrane protein